MVLLDLRSVDLNIGHVEEVISTQLHLKGLSNDSWNVDGVDLLMVSSVLLPHSSVEGILQISLRVVISKQHDIEVAQSVLTAICSVGDDD